MILTPDIAISIEQGRRSEDSTAPPLTAAAEPAPSMHYHAKSTDDELRHGCLLGHRLAQKHLYQRYFSQFLGIPMRYTGQRSEATEVLNQAFLKIFDCMGQYQCTGSFAGWMARIVFNTTIDYVRRRTAYQRKVSLGVEVEKPVQSEVLGQLASEDVFRLVQTLPPATRSVFCLYVVDGYKHAEIGEMLGIDEGTSKWHLSEARRKLKLLLSQHPDF